jgi:hypothetical protein
MVVRAHPRPLIPRATTAVIAGLIIATALGAGSRSGTARHPQDQEVLWLPGQAAVSAPANTRQG